MARRDSSDDYLKSILVIRQERGHCRNVDIAEHMGVTKPSVTKALGNLARESLVEVVDHDVRLTAPGERLAKETLSKHRFFEGALLDAGVDAEVGAVTKALANPLSPFIGERGFYLLPRSRAYAPTTLKHALNWDYMLLSRYN